jgi:hypothetical protein
VKDPKARIAKLEAENKKLDYDLTFLADKVVPTLEAALAEREARRCEDCEACDHCSVQNAAWVRWGPEPDFACNRWTARAEEGSG